MSGYRVVVTDHGFPDLQAEASALREVGAELSVYQCRNVLEVADAVREADAVLTQWAPMTAEAIAAMTHCKVIVRYGIGVDNVDLEAAGKRGIPVVNVPDYALEEVADHAMALLLSLARKLPQVTAKVRAGKWQTNPCRPMRSLRGQTLGLAGFGNIAHHVASRAQAFGMRVAAYDPFVPDEAFEAAGVLRVDFDRLLAASDAISVHLPLTAETHHLFRSETFARMKPDALLINTSRGGVVHSGDLAEALAAGRLGGAGLDVLEQEPVAADSPLITMPNVLLTSHCAWYTEDALERLKRFAALEVVRALQGQPLKHVVNRKWLP
ncbi:C-terminal binding protein [Paenibacillus eucommiae]|uniref:D-3-phosphoglycerate dehydrogenase n=1 Tax=Paenibacillus eucommiae TaxID=1355755 RepID=A0ABS4J8C3_9BACL|nr:C-terminal binding protein [Paenibacillus eucommiae]MBP1995321.1 D-3-phosphoglycerate dehydrogenase [Paenibacillus eucommiae]